jgi:hypothetical protein
LDRVIERIAWTEEPRDDQTQELHCGAVRREAAAGELQMVQGMRIALAIFEMLDPAEGMSGIPGRASEMDTS